MTGIDPAAYEGDIVSRLRHWRGLHLAHGGELFEEAADEIERLRPTDAELETICYVAGTLDHLPWYQKQLRGLLERHMQGRAT